MKAIACVVLTAWAASLPMGIAFVQQMEGPLWFVSLEALGSALGAAVFAMFFGCVALVGARGRPDRLKLVVITTLVTGLLISAVVVPVVPRF